MVKWYHHLNNNLTLERIPLTLENLYTQVQLLFTNLSESGGSTSLCLFEIMLSMLTYCSLVACKGQNYKTIYSCKVVNRICPPLLIGLVADPKALSPLFICSFESNQSDR